MPGEQAGTSDKTRYVNKRQSPMVILYLANRVAPFGKKHPLIPNRNFTYLRGRARLEMHLTAIRCSSNLCVTRTICKRRSTKSTSAKKYYSFTARPLTETCL